MAAQKSTFTFADSDLRIENKHADRWSASESNATQQHQNKNKKIYKTVYHIIIFWTLWRRFLMEMRYENKQ